MRSLLVATRVALTSVAPIALLSFVAPRVVRAEEEPPVPVEEPTPVTEPGAGATPPPAPTEVPSPTSPEPIPLASGGTTSKGAIVTADETTPGHRGPRPVVYRGGRLVLREPSGLLEVSPSGLLHFDAYGFAGPGVKDYQRADGTGLKANLAARRVRVELTGRVLQKWFFALSIESVNGASATPLNNFVGVDLAPMLKLQVGQFRVPFGMDNVSSIRWMEFMERTMTARILGAPLTRDLGVMAWGGTERSAIWWALGYFGGEGQNRRSTDNRGDVVARLVFRPLWKHCGDLGQAHVGVSGRYGRRDRNYTQYDAPSMITPGGYTFWSPVYGSGAGETHVQPSSDQSAVAAELFIPVRWLDLRGEFVAVRDGRREVFAGSRNNTERAGTLSGYGWYAQATFWLMGPPRMVGAPGHWGVQADEHARARSLSLAVRYEQLRARYDSIDRSTVDDVLVPGVRRGRLDADTTRIHVDALQVAATYWASRHVRLVAQWSLYRFPGVPLGFPGAENQAVAPGTRPNADEASRVDARTLHEVSARVQLTF
ncbi:MAG: hypothetical protein HYV09_22855 [Deltaproteobacteria bacterium]|nr:hypothetical protein [Deltaproteobacteria bacterium]